MKDVKNWKLGRLAKIGLSAAVLPTLLVGLVALEQTDTGPATTDGSELVKHLSDLNRIRTSRSRTTTSPTT